MFNTYFEPREDDDKVKKKKKIEKGKKITQSNPLT